MSNSLTLWILIEGSPSAVKVSVDHSSFALGCADLDCLVPLLQKKFKELEGIQPNKLQFFTDTDRIHSLCMDTLLKTLVTTARNPLIVRYPLSDIAGNYLFILCCFEIQ